MKITALSLLTLFIFLAACHQQAESPNFVVILVDDLGYNDVGFMGSEYYQTPILDQLASESLVFTQGYAASSVCSPSRASLLSGRFTARHGITDYIGARTGESWRDMGRRTRLLPADYVDQLPADYKVLPEALKEQGYRTFFAGKWHLGGEGSYPTDHGFDINVAGYEKGGPYSGGYFAPFNNPQMEDIATDSGLHLSSRLARETSEFIRSNKDQKFLAYLSFYSVHAPIQTTREKWEKYRNLADSMGIGEEGFYLERRLPARKAQDNPVYAGLVEHVDDAVGMVLQTLREEGLDKNTVVIFTSDNGGVVSGDNYSTSLKPLRGGKGYQWEGGIRVPFLIHLPNMSLAEKRNETPVMHTDIYPTILELAGAESNSPEVDGQSLLPLFKGGTIESRPLFWHYPHYGNQGGDPSSIIRRDDWKLIHYWENDSSELYNLEQDPAEAHNMAGSNPDKVAALRKELLDFLYQNQAQYPTPDPLYQADSALIYRARRAANHKQRQEARRAAMLQEDWQPNENWWGSNWASEE